MALAVECQWVSQAACDEVGMQLREVGGQEFVAGVGQLGGRPPMPAQQPGAFVGGVCGRERGCGIDDLGQEDAVAAVMGAAAVGEAAFVIPQVPTDVVDDDAGFLGKFAAGGVAGGFAGVAAATGEFPPVVIGVVGVLGVDQKHTMVGSSSSTRAPSRSTGVSVAGMVPCDVGGRGVAADRRGGQNRVSGSLAVAGSEVTNRGPGSTASRAVIAEWSLSRSRRGWWM